LIGPWAHEYPEVALPGPAIGFNQECLRWWDYWLKGHETGIMDEPMLRVWLQDSVPPQTHYNFRPGRWVVEPAWPTPNLAPQTYWLHEVRLAGHAPSEETTLEFQGAQHHGLAAGVWCPYGRPGDLATDQQEEDGLALSFTSAPLAAPLEILGFPEVRLTLASNRPQALLAVRLCDVAPSGASTLVTWGLLNLAHRESHARPSPLEPGQPYTVTIRLNAIAHRLPAGHRWRVAVSPTYWPHAWPAPAAVTLTLYLGQDSYLQLPVRPSQPQDEAITPFEPPEHAPFLAHRRLRSEARQRTVEHDLIQEKWILVERVEGGLCRLEASGLEFGSTDTNIYTIVEGEPLSAMVRCDRMVSLGRGDWQTRVETSSLMSADAEQFHVTSTLDAYEGNTRVFTRTWHCTVPRDLV
jgi:predicted acyl esterase